MNEQYKKDFIQAGAFAREVRAYGKSLIVPGASYNDVITKVNHKIIELGARAAFPPQIALNDVAAHFLPQPGEDIIFSTEVAKLDVGVSYKGAIGDCAVTVDLSGKHQILIDAAEAALLSAEKIIRVGLPIREIGKTIEKTIMSFGLNPVRNLAGHGLARFKIHTAPSIPNYDSGTTALVKAGMTFAIEPFATYGKGIIYDAGGPTIFSLGTVRPIRSEKARALFAKIKNWEGLPFAIHDLIDSEWPLVDVQTSLSELIQAGTVIGHAPLLEETQGFVAQAENSVLVDQKGNVIITTR